MRMRCTIRTNTERREIGEQGTVAFPVAYYGGDIGKYPVELHWHDEIELIVVREGTAIIGVETEKYILQQGEGVFINVGMLHSCVAKDRCKTIIESIVFHPRIVGGSMDSIYWDKYIYPLTRRKGLWGAVLRQEDNREKQVLLLIDDMLRNNEMVDRGYELSVRNQLSQIILILGSYLEVEGGRLTEKNIRDSRRGKLMIAYIHQHFFETLSLEDIAISADISVSECLRCFREVVGMPPMQYVKHYRIYKAAELLASTTYPIVDIGMMCGFSEMSYFAKLFKETYGVTPSKYRSDIYQKE